MFKCVALLGDTKGWKMIKATNFCQKFPDKRREQKKEKKKKKKKRKASSKKTPKKRWLNDWTVIWYFFVYLYFFFSPVIVFYQNIHRWSSNTFFHHLKILMKVYKNRNILTLTFLYNKFLTFFFYFLHTVGLISIIYFHCKVYNYFEVVFFDHRIVSIKIGLCLHWNKKQTGQASRYD